MADKIWSRQEILDGIAQEYSWTARAILALYKLQTEDEKSTGETVHENKVGFNGIDAPILSSFAEQIKNGRHLSTKQLAIARKRLPKYVGQLLNVANAGKVQNDKS